MSRRRGPPERVHYRPMAARSEGLDKDGAAIQEMFDGVAPRYDLLNHVLSVCLDVVWRRRAAASLAATTDGPVLDLCSGTGDQARAVHRRGLAVTGVDFSLSMLARARRKLRRLRGAPAALVAADALSLPFAKGRFGGATVAFGVRNVADLDSALAEMARVLRPRGRVAILEFAVPRRWPVRPLYLFYFRRVLPWIGWLLSPRGAAYEYLRDSVLEFPQRHGFLAHLERGGFEEAAWRDLAGGVVCLYTARRAA